MTVEQKAEEGLNKRFGTMGYLNKQNVARPYTDGFKDGYNKANEWHYVKNGDFPVDTDKVLVCLISDEIVIDCYHSNTGWENYFNNQVYAWKEIVLPKEIE